MKEESLLLLSDLQKLINQVVLIDYTIIILGVELMCREMEKIYSEGMESGEKRGIEKGELKKAKETALSMAEEGMDVKTIARLVKISEKDVQKWIDENLCTMK